MESSHFDFLHYIPGQGPIKDFIHHNTLHAFQGEAFDQAVLRASRLYGARSRLCLSDWEEMSGRGVVSEEGKRFAGYTGSPSRNAGIPLGWVNDGIRVPGFLRMGIDVITETRSPLFRILSNYLDQGIAAHSHAPISDFWSWLRHYFGSHQLNFKLLASDPVQNSLRTDPESALRANLDFLVRDPGYRERYQLEILLSHPGWSGLVHQVELKPSGLFERKPIRMVEVLALETAMDVALAAESGSFSGFTPRGLAKSVIEIGVEESPAELDLRRAQEALEWSFYLKKIRKIESLTDSNPVLFRGDRFRAVFCIDDRECSIRRHLEEVNPETTTYGAAGFFALDCLVQEAGYPHPVQSCPVVLDPRVIIEEEFIDPVGSGGRQGPSEHLQPLSRDSLDPLRAWAHSLWKGFDLARHLIGQVFNPEIPLEERSTYLRVHHHGERDGYQLGYRVSEMADRVAGLFRTIAIDPSKEGLIVFMAHEASSNNNPHYAAYDCGACSGRSGAINSRAFALMANDPAVRAELSSRGFEVHRDLHVIGAVHDTTRDRVRYFDLDRVPESKKGDLERFRGDLEIALGRNALERTRKFELFPSHGSVEDARAHVNQRASAWFEPRPELNHATNAMCVVGRRNLTSGQSFDRRAFLHSYDPATDPEGHVLSNILNAVVPVCGGINLEYYFSRMDNEVYGAGTKLPHNVVGLFGVANGVLGDLRTGLPSQMIEMHDPLRLLVLVEQTPEVALRAVSAKPATFEWVNHEWLHFACLNPRDGKVYRWYRGEWKRVTS